MTTSATTTPAMKTAKHPTLPVTLTFDQARHTYTDDAGDRYRSVTAVVKSLFPPFDAQAAAARIAARENRPAADIIAEWKAKADASVRDGNAAHAYAEALILGTTPPTPANPRQRQAFGMVDKALTMLRQHYDIYSAEAMVFDPMFHVAGTIDLVARNRSTGALAILDWKTCEDITADAWGRTALEPIPHVPDSNADHYAMQLSLYAFLMASPQWSAYPSAGQPVELALIHLPHVGSDPVWRPMVYHEAEAEAVLTGGKAAE
jgi:hypothetical protein